MKSFVSIIRLNSPLICIQNQKKTKISFLEVYSTTNFVKINWKLHFYRPGLNSLTLILYYIIDARLLAPPTQQVGGISSRRAALQLLYSVLFATTSNVSKLERINTHYQTSMRVVGIEPETLCM